VISVLLLHVVLNFCLPFDDQYSSLLTFSPMVAARREFCVTDLQLFLESNQQLQLFCAETSARLRAISAGFRPTRQTATECEG
jgi:hypothetical protein